MLFAVDGTLTGDFFLSFNILGSSWVPHFGETGLLMCSVCTVCVG